MNRVEPLNACRRLRMSMGKSNGVYMPRPYAAVPTPSFKARALRAACDSAVKFALPMNGQILDDPELRAIDATMNLRLPYPEIALEFRAADGGVTGTMILFAWESKARDAICFFSVAVDADATGTWIMTPVISIPTTDFLERHSTEQPILVTHMAQAEDWPKDGAWVLLDFLNALQCSNVKIEKQPARKAPKKAKDALPFDAYHTLVLDVPRTVSQGSNSASQGERRTAREHLRRGHIVRPKGRRPFWRNATVINAGKSASKVIKDYAVRAAP